MTTLLERALEIVRHLSPEEQDDIAQLILQFTGADEQPPVALSSEERNAIASSQAAAERGEFASDEQVRSVWAKYGL